jgi:hypothetical protein
MPKAEADAMRDSFRARVTDPALPQHEPREDLGGKTAFEMALFGAAGEDFGDGDFYYSVDNGRDDLSQLIGGRTDLGQVMTNGRTSGNISLVALALQAQDGNSVGALLKAGATLEKSENPVKILIDGTSNNSYMYTTDNDADGISQSLKALKSADYDINAPIDGRPPAIYMVEEMVTQSISYEDTMGKGNNSNLGNIFKSSAEAGIDFRARDQEGLNAMQSIDQKLAPTDHKVDEQDHIRQDFLAATITSRTMDIQAKSARRALAAQSGDTTLSRAYAKNDEQR